MTFDAHGFVDGEAEAFGKAVVALLGEELQDVVQEFRIGVVGHVVWWLDVFADTPTGNHCGPPSTRFSRAEGRKTIYRSRFTPALIEVNNAGAFSIPAKKSKKNFLSGGT